VITFKNFLESKVIELTNKIENTIIPALLQYVGYRSGDFVKQRKRKFKYRHLGTISYTDPRTNLKRTVRFSLSKRHPFVEKNVGGLHTIDVDHKLDKSHIYIYYPEDQRHIDDFLSTLIHEIIHTLDPKITKGLPQYLGLDLSEPLPEPDFSKDYPEFDAVSGEIYAYYLDIVKTNKKLANRFISELERWLKTERTFFGKQSVPTLFGTYTAFINDWRKNPVFWRKFKQRMYNLLIKLKSLD
jgi:hypothetical protein